MREERRCKTLPYAEPLLALTQRGPAEPTGLPDNLRPPRELLKSHLARFITLVMSTKLVEITSRSWHITDILELRTQEQS